MPAPIAIAHSTTCQAFPAHASIRPRRASRARSARAEDGAAITRSGSVVLMLG